MGRLNETNLHPLGVSFLRDAMVTQRQVTVYQPAVPIRVVAVFRDTEAASFEVNDKHKTVDHDVIIWDDCDVAPVPLAEVRGRWRAEFIVGPADEPGWDTRIQFTVESVQRAERLRAAKAAAKV